MIFLSRKDRRSLRSIDRSTELSVHLVHVYQSIVLDLFTSIINARTSLASESQKNRELLYIARPVVVGFIGYRETGALITFVFQGVQTRGWIRTIHRGRVREKRVDASVSISVLRLPFTSVDVSRYL